MGFVGSVALFGTFAVLLTLAAHVTALARASLTGTEPALIWFVAASGCVFAPLLMIGGWLLYRETHSLDPSLWGSRLRLRPMESRDWLWSLQSESVMTVSPWLWLRRLGDTLKVEAIVTS
jgi:hypothetical protein